jgi:hypothetical protein
MDVRGGGPVDCKCERLGREVVVGMEASLGGLTVSLGG